MGHVILWNDENGNVVICSPAPKPHIENYLQRELGEEEYWEMVMATAHQDGRVVAIEDLPSNDYIDQWKLEGFDVSICPVKVKDKLLQELRARRDALLDSSDKKMSQMRDLNNTKEIAKLKVYRQDLRDITEELKALEAVSVEKVEGVYNDILSKLV